LEKQGEGKLFGKKEGKERDTMEREGRGIRSHPGSSDDLKPDLEIVVDWSDKGGKLKYQKRNI